MIGGLFTFIAFVTMGYWLFKKSKKKVAEKLALSEQELLQRELEKTLSKLIKKIKKRVSGRVLEKVIHLSETILTLLPHLEEMDGADYDLHIVKQTVSDYLPQLLNTYLELPADFAKKQAIKNGKTSQEVLLEQLDILEEQIQKVQLNVHHKDAQALLAQSAFLKSKFEDKDWL
jgi:hypothetical protein